MDLVTQEPRSGTAITGVAVTGMGIRCAGSADASQFWRNLDDGRGAVREVSGLDIGDSECRVGGQIDSVPATGVGDPSNRLLQLLVGVTAAALTDSGRDLSDLDPARIGIVLGQCQGSLSEDLETEFMHALGDQLAAHLGIRGPRTVLSTACTAGAAALALAGEWIVGGQLDLVLAGGIDTLSAFTWHGFSSLQSLSAAGCAAYSRSDGLVLGEGAGIFVMEPLDKVVAEGRTPIAELLGWGSSADAHHITAPDASGRGAVLAMQRATRRAGVSLDAVDYVCGHGTGTQANDEMEVKALRLAFGDRAPEVPLSSIKPMIGHTLGAAGVIEAAATILALHHGRLPPTLNFESDKPPDLDFVPNSSRSAPLRVVMSNNYAFGGNNSSLVFGTGAPMRQPRLRSTDEAVCVTGIGILGSVGSGYGEWFDALFHARTGLHPLERIGSADTGVTIGAEMPELSSRGVTTPSEWRHLDPLSRLALTVSRQAWTDAGLRLSPAQRENFAVIYGSGTGPLTAIRRFQQSVNQQQPSPLHFPNTVYTAAPGHICKAFAVHGPTTTFTSGGIAGTHAVEYAMALIARGEITHALVIAADELSEWHYAAPGAQREYLALDRGVPFQRGSSGANLGAAGVAFVLEAGSVAAARNARCYGTLRSCVTGGDAHASMLPDPRGTTWASVMSDCLGRARIDPRDVGYVACAANGVNELDALETGVVSGVLGRDVAVSAPKSIAGETLGASGAVSLVAALAALQAQAAPPTAGLTDPIGARRVRHVMNAPAPFVARFAIANAFSIGGNYGSIVVQR